MVGKGAWPFLGPRSVVLMLVSVLKRTPHHVPFVSPSKSSVIRDDVSVTTRAIAKVIQVFGVLRAVHLLLD